MKNLLYIGNNLDYKLQNPSYNSKLSLLLEEQGFKVILSSSKTNKISRLLDMLLTVVRLRNQTELVLIDTYSTQNFYYALLVSQLCRLLKLLYIPILHGGNLPKRLEKNPLWSKWVFKYAYTNRNSP